MRIEDIEVGKWYWFVVSPNGTTGNTHSRKVLAKSDKMVVAGFDGGTLMATTWKPEQCLAEDKDKNTISKKDKSWRSLWGLISHSAAQD